MPNPFGVKAGDAPSSEVAEYFVGFHAVPNPHPDLITYRGLWCPKRGLTRISATSQEFREDSSAYRAQALYQRLKRQLASVYGPCGEVEEIDQHAVWGDNDEFVRSLLEDERIHHTRWTEAYGSQLDCEITQISLYISAESYDSSTVNLVYHFNDVAQGQPSDQLGLASL